MQIPPIVLTVVTAHLNSLLHWFSNEMYRRLLAGDQDHFLVHLHEALDCEPLEKACAHYHHSSGPGSPVTHSVPHLVRALLVKYLFDRSLRQLEHDIRWNLLVKWFVGYALFQPGPDHSTLERFELWVCQHQARTLFDEVLRQIDQDFPVERRKAQIGDTFALCANAATESLLRLIRHTCQRLLAALPDRNARSQIERQLDRAALWGAPDETREYWLDATQRQQRLHDTVVAALHCQSLVRAWLATQNDLTTGQVSPWLDILDKILADEVAISRDDQGRVTGVQELPKDHKGSYRIASATDPEATYRVHGESIEFGYNANLAATDTFVREIRTDTGCQPDAVAIPDLITAQREHHDLTPHKLIYDQTAGTGKTHAEVEKASDGQTQLVAPLIDYDERSERFGPRDFTLSADGQSLICPHGQVSHKAYRSQSGQGRTFRFSAQQCQGCPLTEPCRGDQVQPGHMRQVFISDHRSVLDRARTYAQTPAFRQDMKLRPVIERIIANLVRYHGARHARRRGLAKCDFQVKMNAMAFNIRQWLRLRERRRGLIEAGQT